MKKSTNSTDGIEDYPEKNLPRTKLNKYLLVAKKTVVNLMEAVSYVHTTYDFIIGMHSYRKWKNICFSDWLFEYVYLCLLIYFIEINFPVQF